MQVGERIKAALINTRIGLFAHSVRGRLELYRAVNASPELLGMLSNDDIARQLLERLCAGGKTFIDVGAHVGSVIRGVMKYSQPGRVIAIEAIPEKALKLRKNFPSVEVHDCAVGDAEGEVPFFIYTEASGYSSLDPEQNAENGRFETITVMLRRLDSIVEPRNVDLIKIDVEGRELGVLNGASAIISESRPVIMFESAPRRDSDLEALWQWFEDNDYAVLVPNRVPHEDTGLSREGFVEAHRYPRRATNYFGMPRERRDAMRQRARKVLGFD